MLKLIIVGAALAWSLPASAKVCVVRPGVYQPVEMRAVKQAQEKCVEGDTLMSYPAPALPEPGFMCDLDKQVLISNNWLVCSYKPSPLISVYQSP